MRAHNHDDVDRITFGCDGCIARAEQARIDNAPLRLCVWHCDYWADVSDDPEHRSLTFARKVRVPNGWTWEQVANHYVDEAHEGFVMALPSDVPISRTDYSLDSMEITKVVVGELVLDPAEPQGVQETLL